MSFNFVDSDEEVDEEIDWSELDKDEEPLEVAGMEFNFDEAIPEARSITDPEIKKKAAKGRQRRRRSVDNRNYDGKRAAGLSLFCAHKDHLPNLCEKYQLEEGYTCTHDCHEERGFVRPTELSDGDDEAFVFNFN